MTQRLYYQDAHLSRFQAVVVSCREDGGRWAVVLDRTAFFPEGGGQPADTGRLGDQEIVYRAQILGLWGQAVRRVTVRDSRPPEIRLATVPGQLTRRGEPYQEEG